MNWFIATAVLFLTLDAAQDASAAQGLAAAAVGPLLVTTPNPSPPKTKVPKPAEDNKRAEPLETTKIEPELTYRMAYLDIREDSAFHKEEHLDYIDQLYLNLRFFRDRDLRQEVVLEPSIRTPRGNPDRKSVV